MKPVFEIHPVQAKILRVLLFQTEAKFAQLNPDKMGSDHFNFHLKALLGAGLLEKKANSYFLTARGKEFANRFDTEKIIIERQAKLTLGVLPIKIVNGKRYYLVHQRLKQPYYGYYGSVNGKIRWGEKVFDAAKRELIEETGLTALKMRFIGIYHKSDYSSDGELLEDKYFFRIRVDKFSGRLKKSLPEGKNFWATKDEIRKLDHLFADFSEAIAFYNEEKSGFVEKDFIAEGY